MLAPRPIFSVDVEDWFQVSAFDEHVSRNDWDSLESRVEANTYRILELLEREGPHSGTFFVLGWVAERFPALVRAIVDSGHELASHGYGHERITALTPTTFRTDLTRAKAVLEQASGRKVRGYRAPSFSLTDAVGWAPEILVETGHTYDSSRFPIARRGYGASGAPRQVHTIHTPSGPLREYPPAVWQLGQLRLPVAGGGWFRQFPYAITEWGLASVLAEGIPAMFYLHPWEIDAHQPRLPVPLLTRVRHYRGLDATERRLVRLLNRFSFTSVAKLDGSEGQ